ncbi:MAG: glycosyltransferase family 39 protein [Solirubrobacteraceae bacterium]
MSTSDSPAVRLGRPRLPKLGAASAVRAVPAEVWILAALTVLAAVIRIITIDNQSLWADEALTAYEARLPFGAMLNTVAQVETTPPLYFVLIWAWGHVFGTGAVALRSVSTLAGIAMVPLAYLAARELVSRRAGVIAAALVAVNPFLIWYSQEARAYMLLAALTGASFLWFIRARRDLSRRNLAGWTVFSSLALMTHFFAGFAVAPEALWLLGLGYARAAPGLRRPVALAVGVVAAAQAAMLPFAFLDTSHGVGWIGAIPRLHRIANTAAEWGVSIFYRRTTVLVSLGGAAILLAALVFLLGLGGDGRTRRAAAVGGVITGCVMLIPLALGFLGQDYFVSRNLIGAVIPLVTILAAACVVPRARVLGGALAVGLLVMFSVATVRVQTKPYLERPQWRNVVRALGPAAVPRAILAADGTTADPLKIYLPHVNWVQARSHRFLISEVDVVGATKRLPLLPGRDRAAALASRHRGRRPVGSSVPVSLAPAGARLLSRVRVNNWIVARFALAHPVSISINRLDQQAPEYFRRTPNALMVFIQQRG